jgi:membrane protein DedA with SNARE-associated domain/rhodanese-related sulfurtransferase
MVNELTGDGGTLTVEAVHVSPAFVFVSVLLNQIGVPVPVVPTLIVAGAIAEGDGGLLGMMGLYLAAIAACAIADGSWYLAGRRYGGAVMGLFCRISLTPDVCISQAHRQFERWGSNTLIIAKFVPGLAIIAPPIAGATRMHPMRFGISTLVGGSLWAGLALGAGRLIRPQVEHWLPHIVTIGSIAAAVVGAVLASYVVFKWWERHRYSLQLRTARITATDLHDRILSRSPPLIVDVRTHTAYSFAPHRIPGAIHMPLQEISRHAQHLSRDREIVLYCTCPNEASAAQAARLLMKAGTERVRSLDGGLEAWIQAGYAVESPTMAVTLDAARGDALSGTHEF